MIVPYFLRRLANSFRLTLPSLVCVVVVVAMGECGGDRLLAMVMGVIE